MDQGTSRIQQKITEALEHNPQTIECLDGEIHDHEVLEAIKELKTKKACGPDNIQNEMIMASTRGMRIAICKLFNLILTVERVPRQWGLGFISPVFKKGNSYLPENYRGLSISSNLGKLFNRIMNKRVTNFLLDNRLLHISQIGFLKGACTGDHLFVLKCIIESLKKDKRKLYACFIDLKKAFDTVWRDGLLYKIASIGCSRKFTNIIRSMYTDLQCAVKCNQSITTYFPSEIGTRQGCNLSPILFNIYLNDLANTLQQENCSPPKYLDLSINCLMYADDVVLLSTSEVGLRRALAVTHQYCTKWKLNISYDKTKIVVFNTRKIYKFKLGNHIIESCSSVPYLGLYLQATGRFTKAIETLYMKASRAYFLIRQKIYSQNIPVKSALHLFDTLIKPILLYGCEVWFLFEILKRKTQPNENITENILLKPLSMIEKLHIKACRNILSVGQKSPIHGVMAELGRSPLSLDCLKKSLHYCAKITLSATCNNSLITQVWNNSQMNPVLQPYRHLISRITKDCNLPVVNSISIPNSNVSPLKKYKNQVSVNLKNYSGRLLMKSLQNQEGKLSFYKTLKKAFGFERYLSDITDPNHRSAFTRIRISCHKLPIEVGRYQRIPRDQRICTQCTLKTPGTEIHVLTSCPGTQNQREIMLKEACEKLPQLTLLKTTDQIRYLLSGHDNAVNINFANYVYHVLSSYL
jgi:hypothetical protein